MPSHPPSGKPSDDSQQESQTLTRNANPSQQQQAAQSGKPTMDTQRASDTRSPAAGQDANGSMVQGEGDYASNRRYTESVKDFVASGKVDAAARAAKPHSQQEAKEMRQAEREGAAHAKGTGAPSDRKGV